MLPLSSSVICELYLSDALQIIENSEYKVYVYVQNSERILNEYGFINVVIFEKRSFRSIGIEYSDFESSSMKIKFQESVGKLNSSHVVGVSLGENIVKLQHWDGFRTTIILDGFYIIDQVFTK